MGFGIYITANLLTEIRHDVSVKPDLQPITGETFCVSFSSTRDSAMFDTAKNGFWGGIHEETFCDVRVLDPHASSNRNTMQPSFML